MNKFLIDWKDVNEKLPSVTKEIYWVRENYRFRIDVYVKIEGITHGAIYSGSGSKTNAVTTGFVGSFFILGKESLKCVDKKITHWAYINNKKEKEDGDL